MFNKIHIVDVHISVVDRGHPGADGHREQGTLLESNLWNHSTVRNSLNCFTFRRGYKELLWSLNRIWAPKRSYAQFITHCGDWGCFGAGAFRVDSYSRSDLTSVLLYVPYPEGVCGLRIRFNKRDRTSLAARSRRPKRILGHRDGLAWEDDSVQILLALWY